MERNRLKFYSFDRQYRGEIAYGSNTVVISLIKFPDTYDQIYVGGLILTAKETRAMARRMIKLANASEKL